MKLPSRLWLASIFVVLPVCAHAGPYGDDMGQCLVRSTTPADKTTFVRWMFSMMALHPDVQDLSKVTDAERASLNQNVASLMASLLTKSCLKESQEALKYEGAATLESSFGLLGQVAARELFIHPDVAAGLADFGKIVEALDLQKVLSESGIVPAAEPPPAPAAAPEVTP